MVGTSNHSETDMAMAIARLKEQAFDGRGSPNSSAKALSTSTTAYLVGI